MKRVAYYLSDQQFEGLKKLSKTTGLPVSELIRRAVDALLRNAKRAGKDKDGE